MTTERGSFDDPGTDPNATGDDALGNVDALVGTREDTMTSAGLSDAPFPSGSSTSSASTGTGSTGSSGSSGSMGSSGSGDRLQEAAGNVVDRVTGTAQQQVGTQVNSQLDRGAELLSQVSDAIRKTGEQLREQQPQVASLADTAAQQVDRAGQFLRQTDFQGLIRESEDFARRQPAVFLGGAFALGLVASRFLKASPQGGSGSGRYDRSGSQFGRGFGSGYGGGYDRSYGAGSYGGSAYGGAAGSTYGAGYGTGTGGAAYGSAQANYAGSDTGPYGGTSGTQYAEAGSGAEGTGSGVMNSDQGAEHGGV